MNQDLIIGIHSILLALEKRNRSEAELYATREVVDSEFSKFKNDSSLQIHIMDNESLQREAQRHYSRLEYEFQRIQNGCFLLIEAKTIRDLSFIYEASDKKETYKIIALDGVTDVHNRAAIFRTAAFYGVDCILISQKNLETLPPSFYRISSGGAEEVEIVNCASLSRAIENLNQKGFQSIGFDERPDSSMPSQNEFSKLMIVLGAEDTGLSNAVQRVLKQKVSLDGPGKLKTLNVSVSAAVAMQKLWGL